MLAKDQLNKSVVSNSLVSFLLAVGLLFVPLSYTSVGTIRLIVLFPSLMVIYAGILLVTKFDINRPDKSWYAIFLLLMYSMGSILITGNINFFYTTFIFMTFAYWPFLINRKYLTLERFFWLLRLYSILVILTGVGVIFQYLIWTYVGLEIGFIRYYQERVGFGFLWRDFSFLSLYLVCAIPLFFAFYRKNTAIFFAVFVILAAVVTSARTGLFAFFLFVGLYSLNIVAARRIKKERIGLVLASLVLPVMILLLIETIGVRGSVFSASNRTENWLLGIKYWLDNPFFGAWLDADLYRSSAGTVPHNVFVYTLAMGGLFFFLIFIIWLSLVLNRASNTYKPLMSSIFIAFLGLNFIPSVFSGYFFAYMISLIFFYDIAIRGVILPKSQGAQK